MSRTTATSLGIAVVGILAIAVAAATLTTAVAPANQGPGQGGGGFAPGGGQSDVETPPVTIPFAGILQLIWQALMVIATVALLAWLVINYRESVPLFVLLGAFIAFAVILIYLVWTLTSPPTGGAAANGTAPPPNATGPGGESSTTVTPSSPSLIVLAVLGIGIVGTVIALVRARGGAPEEIEPEPESDEAEEIAEAAGRAADEIEAAETDAEVDNAVYRAWRDMTGLLQVQAPETTSPREFAEAAVAAGIDRDDVEELTDLFERVRYGHREPTEEYEQRALETFRRIEAAYAGGEGG